MTRARNKRRVAVVTGSRAEFGLLEPVLHAMQGHPRLDPRLIVTGMHLLPKFGRTIEHIRAAGWRIDATVRMQTGEDAAAAEPLAVARGMAGIARALHRLRCEIVVVLGDRIEAFAAASAAATGRLIVAHIHGGDRATGDVDDALRNAITRLAHVHLVASRDAADRLKRMGEAPERIHRVGAPGLDAIRVFHDTQRADPARCEELLRARIGSLADRSYAVVLHHPCGRLAHVEAATMRHIVAAVTRCGLAGVAIFPNSDPGHEGILKILGQVARKHDWRRFWSLPREDYLRLVSRAAVLVGNSSSGIIESASLRVNAVNVGSRQLGRLRCGPNVIDCGETAAAITAALRTALDRPRPSPQRSRYGDGQAGPRIAEILDGLDITPDLRQKALTY